MKALNVAPKESVTPMQFSDALSAEQAQHLIERLEALKAEWPSEPSLHSVSPQTAEALMTRFAEVEKTGAPLVRSGVILFTLLPLGMAAISLFDYTAHGLLKLAIPAFLAIPATAGLSLIWGLVHTTLAGKWPHTVYALTQADDVCVLETLILATRYKWGRHAEIVKAINRLLEQVTEADAGVLSDRAQQRLWTIGIAWQTLADEYDPQVATRVLRALTAVGNRATLVRMERFAYRSEHFINERYAIAAARELLPVMLARLQRQQVPETLLRAAALQSDTLLRCAHVTTSEPTVQLLRASTSDHPGADA